MQALKAEVDEICDMHEKVPIQSEFSFANSHEYRAFC